MKAVMVTTKDGACALIKEMGDEISKEDVVIKIIPKQEFDSLVSPKSDLDVDMSDEQFLALAKIAHEQDITFNQLVNNILREKMEEENDKTSSNS